MADPSWRLRTNNDDTVDEVVMKNAYVHFEDLGNAAMLIVENGDQHIHLTIPLGRIRRPFVFEQHTPGSPSGGPEPLEGTE